MIRQGFPARRITTTAEPCSSFDRDRAPGLPALAVFTVYREPAQYSPAVPEFVYRTPARDVAAALVAELNRTRTGTENYFFHKSDGPGLSYRTRN